MVTTSSPLEWCTKENWPAFWRRWISPYVLSAAPRTSIGPPFPPEHDPKVGLLTGVIEMPTLRAPFVATETCARRRALPERPKNSKLGAAVAILSQETANHASQCGNTRAAQSAGGRFADDAAVVPKMPLMLRLNEPPTLDPMLARSHMGPVPGGAPPWVGPDASWIDGLAICGCSCA